MKKKKTVSIIEYSHKHGIDLMPCATYAKAKEIKVIVESFEDVVKNCPPHTSVEKRKAIEEYAWMIEEYKVSIFAQELKTAFPVSRKRLDQKLLEIEEMM